MFEYKEEFLWKSLCSVLPPLSVSLSHVAVENFRGGCGRSMPSCVEELSAGSAASDEGLIDGAVNKCQGSLPASAARGAGDEETEVERLI